MSTREGGYKEGRAMNEMETGIREENLIKKTGPRPSKSIKAQLGLCGHRVSPCTILVLNQTLKCAMCCSLNMIHFFPLALGSELSNTNEDIRKFRVWVNCMTHDA